MTNSLPKNMTELTDMGYIFPKGMPNGSIRYSLNPEDDVNCFYVYSQSGGRDPIITDIPIKSNVKGNEVDLESYLD